MGKGIIQPRHKSEVKAREKAQACDLKESCGLDKTTAAIRYLNGIQRVKTRQDTGGDG